MHLSIARRGTRRGFATVRPAALLSTALALSCTALFVGPSVASATPVEGPAGAEFYTPPEVVEGEGPAGKAGELIWYRPATVNLNVTLPSVNAWSVLYQSSNQHGAPDFVTGTVIVPTATWKGSGPRPVVTVGIGTQGLAHECAPSLQMAAGTEYDGGEIAAAVKQGYAVAVTDYQGYTNDAIPTYIAGKAEGQAVLDIVRAAREVPGAGISSSAPTIAWGYSQGGQAVSWAGELQPSYAPDVNLVGVAAGGVPGNLQEVAAFDNGSVGAAFALESVIGLNHADPEFGLFSFTNSEGVKAQAKLLGECAIKSIAEFRDDNLSQFTSGGKTFEQVEAEFPNVKKVVEEQTLGTKPIPVPVYHYHGLEDEFVPVSQDVALHQAWCSLGVTDDFKLYPGDHLLTDPTAVPTVMKWIEERFAGKKAPSTCGLHEASAKLPASARLTPMTGDLVVPLPAWQLTGTVTEKKSGISIEIPAGATLSAQADLTNETLGAQLSIPPLNQTIKVANVIPINVKGSLTPTGPISGKVSLSTSGVLSQSAEGSANMLVASVGLGFFTVPLGCQTTKPIQLPLSISEPVNALETGGFGINTEVTVPEFGGCGLFFGPLLSSLMSGPENTISLTAAPPPPISW